MYFVFIVSIPAFRTVSPVFANAALYFCTNVVVLAIFPFSSLPWPLFLIEFYLTEEQLRPLKPGSFLLRVDRDKLRKGAKTTSCAVDFTPFLFLFESRCYFRPISL